MDITKQSVQHPNHIPWPHRPTTNHGRRIIKNWLYLNHSKTNSVHIRNWYSSTRPLCRKRPPRSIHGHRHRKLPTRDPVWQHITLKQRDTKRQPQSSRKVPRTYPEGTEQMQFWKISWTTHNQPTHARILNDPSAKTSKLNWHQNHQHQTSGRKEMQQNHQTAMVTHSIIPKSSNILLAFLDPPTLN